MERADCQSLNNYFSTILKVKLKREIPLACIVKNIFAGKTQEEDKSYIVKKKWTPNKGIYIEYLTGDTLEVKRIIKLILKSLSWHKRYSCEVELIPK